MERGEKGRRGEGYEVGKDGAIGTTSHTVQLNKLAEAIGVFRKKGFQGHVILSLKDISLDFISFHRDIIHKFVFLFIFLFLVFLVFFFSSSCSSFRRGLIRLQLAKCCLTQCHFLFISTGVSQIINDPTRSVFSSSSSELSDSCQVQFFLVGCLIPFVFSGDKVVERGADVKYTTFGNFR